MYYANGYNVQLAGVNAYTHLTSPINAHVQTSMPASSSVGDSSCEDGYHHSVILVDRGSLKTRV